jgi:hypothetical protein
VAAGAVVTGCGVPVGVEVVGAGGSDGGGGGGLGTVTTGGGGGGGGVVVVPVTTGAGVVAAGVVVEVVVVDGSCVVSVVTWVTGASAGFGAVVEASFCVAPSLGAGVAVAGAVAVAFVTGVSGLCARWRAWALAARAEWWTVLVGWALECTTIGAASASPPALEDLPTAAVRATRRW